jgi:hypothetical protein
MSVAKTAIAVSTAICVACWVHLTTVLRAAGRVPTEVHWYTHATSECRSCDLVMLHQSVCDRHVLKSRFCQDHSVMRKGGLGPDARRHVRVNISPDIGAFPCRICYGNHFTATRCWTIHPYLNPWMSCAVYKCVISIREFAWRSDCGLMT